MGRGRRQLFHKISVSSPVSLLYCNSVLSCHNSHIILTTTSSSSTQTSQPSLQSSSTIVETTMRQCHAIVCAHRIETNEERKQPVQLLLHIIFCFVVISYLGSLEIGIQKTGYWGLCRLDQQPSFKLELIVCSVTHIFSRTS